MKQRKIIHYASRLTDVSGAFVARELKREGIDDLVPAYGDVLAMLFETPSLSISELARRTHRTKSTVSFLCSKLEKFGYVVRTRNGTDQRALDVSLTDRGRAIKQAFERISDRLAQRLSSSLSDGEMQMLEALLAKALTGVSRSVLQD